MKRCATAVVIAVSLALAGCGDGMEKPAIVIEGGGFIFNYRVAEVFYGVSVRPQRRLEPGSSFEAEFEDPAGGPPIRVEEKVTGQRLSYALRTPPVEGVRAGRDYHVIVRLKAPDGREIASTSRILRSDLDQEMNPEQPLTVGPGYTPNPERKP